MTMTLDILRISQRPDDGHPFLTGADANKTQVVLLDNEDDGPYFHLWSIFAKKPTLRFKDLVDQLDHTPLENVIVPLAGVSNTLW
jgi:protein O-GlcNAc transferase